jgi:hypothetical protein
MSAIGDTPIPIGPGVYVDNDPDSPGGTRVTNDPGSDPGWWARMDRMSIVKACESRVRKGQTTGLLIGLAIGYLVFRGGRR